jgi:hypothetical protein
MNLELLEPDHQLVSVDPAEIFYLLGKTDLAMEQYTRNLVETYIPICKEVMTPSGGVAWCESEEPFSVDAIQVDGIRFQVGKIIGEVLKDAEAFAFFVATAGPGPETLARQLLAKGDYLDGMIVDLIASGIVESVADQVHERIRAEAGYKGMKVTNRYSPGYCSWNVEEQQKLFGLLPMGCCGITLSGSSLMSPIKSVSGVIGIGPDVTYQASSCTICPMKNCAFRKPGARNR